mmetsp:Transcript_69047/g.84656  ORF Transcript_69047/g.84656 Transcript_69047/m.84656 type:complete len:285 (-) Transcript_69047:294-1148(-)
MKCLCLNGVGVGKQKVHHYLQVLLITDIAHHHPLEISIHQHSSKQGQRLSLHDVILTLQQRIVQSKELIIVCEQPRTGHLLVLKHGRSKSIDRICRHVNARMSSIANQLKGLSTCQKSFNKLPVAKERAKNHTREECGLLVGIAVHQFVEQSWVKPDVLHDLGGHLFGQVRPKEGAADIHYILADFEVQTCHLRKQLHGQISSQKLLQHVQLFLRDLRSSVQQIALPRSLGEFLEKIEDDEKMLVHILPKFFSLGLRLRRARAAQELTNIIRELLHCIPRTVPG